MSKQEALKPIEILFNRYAAFHQHPTNKLLHWITVPLVIFSGLGLIWAIPFPHLEFLGRYNGFVNWASFLIAFAIYYYYRLSPVLSYGMLLFVFAASAGIVGLEKMHNNKDWPEMWQVCLAILVLSLIGQLFGHKVEGKKMPLLESLKFILIAPLWLLHILFKNAGLRH